MVVESSSDTKYPTDTIAYLVVREGNQWRDVFRLTPGHVTTIGRAPTNRIVVRDEVCSRNHCEVFRSGSKWTLRDLGSRNGTLVDGMPSVGDRELEEGQLIRIGLCDLGFTFDLSRPLPDVDEMPQQYEGESEVDSGYELVFDNPAQEAEPAIIHRASETRFHADSPPEATDRDSSSRELAQLYRLALEMGAAQDSQSLAKVVLDGLFDGTCADIGAILLLPEGATADPQPGEFLVVAYKSKGDQPYQKVSDHLSESVLSSREAVLARDVADDSRLASRDSLGQIHAKSVICAPLRIEEAIHGVIHLYSTNPDNPLDPDDLEFTLAVADQLALAFENLKQRESLADGLARAQDENLVLRRQLDMEHELIGDHATMVQLRENILRIAPTDATVLVRGESGTGKELVSRAIHGSSERHGGPFICMNCAALSESLLESELFGHEKGSFTGATMRKLGKFEQADGGSLFLDEVGEMSLPIQAKFLRVLEGHPFERVGGAESIHVNVRVVAATNRDLEEAVREGVFRKDLYFRLHVVDLTVPSLRDHLSDVPLLANYFLERIVRRTGRPVKGVSPEALDVLMNHEWPGNIRQLQNAIERAVILSPGELVEAGDIQLSTLGGSPRRQMPPSESVDTPEVSLEVVEKQHILSTLSRTSWNKSRAAQILGIERSTLDRKLKRYKISRPPSDPAEAIDGE
jgi:two-component system response regulator HydG